MPSIAILLLSLDIQEFYESILLDDQSDRSAKMSATLHLADEWEKEPMLKRDIRVTMPVRTRTILSSVITSKTFKCATALVSMACLLIVFDRLRPWTLLLLSSK